MLRFAFLRHTLTFLFSLVGQSVGESQDLWEHAEAEHEDRRQPNKVREDIEQDKKDRWVVMLITVAGCLAFKNDAIGFLAGLIWHWGLRLPAWIKGLRRRRNSVSLRRGSDRESSDGLLGQ